MHTIPTSKLRNVMRIHVSLRSLYLWFIRLFDDKYYILIYYNIVVYCGFINDS